MAIYVAVQKVSFEESLVKHVITPGKCVGCGTCVVVCPFKCLEYAGDKPTIVKECEVCGVCAQVCPRHNWRWSDAEKFLYGRRRKPTEVWGIYKRLALAQAGDAEILKVGQDGGVTTALLSFALQQGIIDGAALSGVSKERPLFPEPKLASTPGDVRACAGTRYTYSPNILALAEAVKLKKSSLAFVGTPCQIHAVRKIQMFPLKKYAKTLNFTVGLMCTESFTYEGFVQNHLKRNLRVNPGEVKKVNIKGKILVTTPSETKGIPLAEVKKYVRGSCMVCDDFSSMLADISVGGLGLNNWTFTIIRTEAGENIFSKAQKSGAIKVKPVEEDSRALTLLKILSKRKNARNPKKTNEKTARQ